MSQDLSSAAVVIGALRVKIFSNIHSEIPFVRVSNNFGLVQVKSVFKSRQQKLPHG